MITNYIFGLSSLLIKKNLSRFSKIMFTVSSFHKLLSEIEIKTPSCTIRRLQKCLDLASYSLPLPVCHEGIVSILRTRTPC